MKLNLALAAVILFAGCAARAVRPASRPVAFFLSADPSPASLARQATLVRAARLQGPCYWVFGGELFEDSRLALLTDGAGQRTLLDAAGVDAVVFGPDWLEFGARRLARLLGDAKFAVIGANLTDTMGEPVAYPFVTTRMGSETYGLLGLWQDSSAVGAAQDRSRWIEPGYSAARNLPLVRERAPVVGVAVRPGISTPGLGADFCLGAGSAEVPAVTRPDPADIGKLELTTANGVVTDARSSQLILDGVEFDPAVQLVADSLGAVLDSVERAVAAELKSAMAPAAVEKAVVEVLGRSGVDALVLDHPLAQQSLGPGRVSVGQVIGVLAEPARPCRLTLKGRQVKALAGNRTRVLWKKELQGKRVMPDQRYQVVATRMFVLARSELAAEALVADEPLWQIAVRALNQAGR